MEPLHLFIIFLVTGLIFVGAEIFVPGGILGVFGGLALIGACITGFNAFPGYGAVIVLGIHVAHALQSSLRTLGLNSETSMFL